VHAGAEKEPDWYGFAESFWRRSSPRSFPTTFKERSGRTLKRFDRRWDFAASHFTTY
jgi:hypothetical protein